MSDVRLATAPCDYSWLSMLRSSSHNHWIGISVAGGSFRSCGQLGEGVFGKEEESGTRQKFERGSGQSYDHLQQAAFIHVIRT